MTIIFYPTSTLSIGHGCTGSFFGSSIFCFVIGAAIGWYLYFKFPADRYWLVGAVLLALGLVLAIGPGLHYISADFAVTDKRVLAKHGIVRRQSLETLLSKVEAIGVDQDVTGRLLNYGTITITGTGGTRETLPMIAQPMEFRRRVQAQIVAPRIVAAAATASGWGRRCRRRRVSSASARSAPNRF